MFYYATCTDFSLKTLFGDLDNRVRCSIIDDSWCNMGKTMKLHQLGQEYIPMINSCYL